jgi:CBS domain-containing protein
MGWNRTHRICDDLMVVQLQETGGLTAADVMHSRISTLPASATVGDLRAYFAESGSRKLALLADGDRYAGAVSITDLTDDLDDAAPARDQAVTEPTIGPGSPAEEARELALQSPALRLPVVNDAGKLVGIVAIDDLRTRFCGT